MLAVTIWQWIVESVTFLLGGILFIVRGEHRIADHFMAFLIIWIVHVILPAFYLLADFQFRRSLEQKGLVKAIVGAITQIYQ